MRTLEVSIEGKPAKYEIVTGKNTLDGLYGHVSARYKGRKAVIITDGNVERLYGEKLYKGIEGSGVDCRLIAVAPGEKSKSLETLSSLYDAFSSFAINRGDVIIALGGGVVGDLAGFAAATYLRGIAYIQVPTTLLAQVDSSVGGKTAIDLPGGKNLVGAFYQPEKVFIDTTFLDTLEDRYLRDGMAEVIKYGCIKDGKLFERLMAYEDIEECIKDIDELVHACCSIKKSVVERDEKDRGERMLLNFGHTLGHAVEQYFNYGKYTHGEAVAIGMAEITRRSEAAGITQKGSADAIERLLRKYRLPYMLPVDKGLLLDAMKLDKKNIGGSIGLVLLKKPGNAFVRNMSHEELHVFI